MLNNRQTLQMENVMGDLKKSDCIAVESACTELGIVRNTLNAYLNALGVAKHKFPFDRRVYITKSDYERVRQFVEENK